MRLFEEFEQANNSMTAAIKKMIKDIFDVELDDEKVEQIVNDLKLSELLVLDAAYTNRDKSKISRVLKLDNLQEYSMGHQSTSAASTRPTWNRRNQGASSGQPTANAGNQNDQNATGRKASVAGQTTRNYSTGVQNGVSTNNIDYEDDVDPDDPTQDDEVKENVVDMMQWLRQKAGIK
jgi:hypothetical protein